MFDERRRTRLSREARALATQGGLIARSLLRRRRPLEGERVAVFVHGYLAAGAVFDPMRRRVEREVGIETLDFTYTPSGTFEAIVERFAEHLDRYLPEDATVSLVGHSLGGLVARSYLHERGGAERVDRVVTIATPHAGTHAARYVPFELTAALRPGSPVVERLARSHGEVDVPHVSIVATEDRMCVPPESAAALEGAEVHRFDVGHNEALYDARVQEVVARSLR